MGAFSSKLRSVKDTGGGEGFAHWCPGCDGVHVIMFKRGSFPGPIWTYDGNAEAPTCSPSIRLFDKDGTICHYFLKGGEIDFCGDCRHALSGTKVPLPVWPYAPGTYGGVED